MKTFVFLLFLSSYTGKIAPPSTSPDLVQNLLSDRLWGSSVCKVID